MMCHSLPALPKIALLAASALVAACATGEQPGPVGPPATTPRATLDEPAQLRADEASEREVLQRRRRIEARGDRFDCDTIKSTPTGGWDNWLEAWCRWHRREWVPARRAALRALPYFESTGAVRRQIELHLLAALAAARDRTTPTGDAPHARRALRLAELSAISLHGGPGDPYAGDLPYLFARALREGLGGMTITARNGVDASPELLLRIARWNYRTNGLPESVFRVQVERTATRLAAGDIGPALEQLETVLEIGRRNHDKRQLREGMALFGQLAVQLDLPNAREALEPWLQKTTAAERSPLSDQQLDDLSPEAFARWLTTAERRDRVTETIARVRADPDLAVRPPPTLVDGLRALSIEETLDRGAWRLSHQSGLLLAEQGYRKASRRFLTHAVSSLESVRAGIPDPELRQSFFADKRPIYRALVDSYVGIDTANLAESDYRRALRVANGVKARGLIDLLTGDIEPKQTVEHRESSWEAADSLDLAAREVLSHLKDWTKGSERSAESLQFSGPLPGDLRERIDDDTVLVEYLLGPNQSYVWVLTDERLQMRRIAGGKTLEPLVERFLETLVQPKLTDEAFERHRKLGERLFVELLGPIEDVVSDHDRIIVAADQSLYRLPFEALIRPDRDAGIDYVVADHVVSYTPSTGALDLLVDRRPPPKRGTNALVLGAPDLDRPAIDLLALTENLPKAGMFEMSRMFPDLPGGRRELQSVDHLLQNGAVERVDRRTGSQATEHFLRTRDLRDYRLIHLTTHGVSDARPIERGPGGSLQMRQPALMLTQNPDQPEDGVLTLAEILGYRTAADLVVLSGCTTGRGWRALGEGAYGLAGAFIYAGARHVIASTWDVADRNTPKLMREVYRALRDGKPPADALTAGQRALLERNPGERPLPPYFWAGFRTVDGTL